MIPQDVADKMEATVKGFLNQGRMFTGYDVTIETRTREKMSLRHQDVRGAVHEMEVLNDAMDFGYDMNGTVVKWAKTQKDMPGGGWAFVYHPANVDPNGYQPRNPQQSHKPAAIPMSQAAISPAPPSLSISLADGATSDSGGSQSDGSFATDYRERLMIPTRFMKEAGIQPGDMCYVVPDSATNMVFIVKDEPKVTGISVTTQKVEKDGELRLSSRTLKAASLTDNKFIIETTEKDFSGSKSKVVAVKAVK